VRLPFPGPSIALLAHEAIVYMFSFLNFRYTIDAMRLVARRRSSITDESDHDASFNAKGRIERPFDMCIDRHSGLRLERGRRS